MFAFLKTQLMVDDDPLQTSATASVWLRGLPAQDVTGRQRHILTALGEARRMGATQPTISRLRPPRLAA